MLTLALIACGDLALDADRAPATLQLDSAQVTVTEGQPVVLGMTVLDAAGEPLVIPAWAVPTWTSSNEEVVNANGSAPTAAGPGQATATATLAGVTGSARVRVNPAEIRLSVDSVGFRQSAANVSVLVENVPAVVRIFMTADRPNFFSPRVRVEVRDGEALVFAGEAEAPREIVPRQIDIINPWEMTLPAEAVRPGHTLEIIPDPARELRHAAGSTARFPAAGPLPLRFAVTFRVVTVQVTQSVQRPDGSVPLIAGRDALVRVFATSAEGIALRPAVRVSLFHGEALVSSYEVQRALESFPKTMDEGLLNQSWNVRIDGSLIRPGVSVMVEVDPDHLIPRTPESSPRFPAAGRMALDVREVPTLWVRMIPVYQTAFDLTGNVGEHNLGPFLGPTMAKFPLARIDADLRAPYSTDAQLDTDSGWRKLLSEIRALRQVEGSGRYYYGVVRNPPGSRIGGMGYLGWPSAIGHDAQGAGWETMAHELGHNFDLPHAPCGDPAGVDPAFPYPDGGIGVYGYDVRSGLLKSPTVQKDLMTYCRPEWISDYNYLKVFAYRDAHDWTTTGPDASGVEEPALLVWGRVSNGAMVLEPAFELAMKPALPEGGGNYRIEGLDAGGTVVFSFAFEPDQMDHTDGKGFSFAIPTRLAPTARLHRLRLIGPEGEVVRRRGAADPRAAAAARRVGDDVALTWDAGELPMALVRDAATGEVLSFARGGEARMRAPGRELDVTFSDGVRSVRHSIIPR